MILVLLQYPRPFQSCHAIHIVDDDIDVEVASGDDGGDDSGDDGGDQGCISCGILVSGIRARGVSSEHMENMEMFSCSPT